MSFGPAPVPEQDDFFHKHVVPFIDEAAEVVLRLYATRRDPAIIAPIREAVRQVMALCRHIYEPDGFSKSGMTQLTVILNKGHKALQHAREVLGTNYI